MRTTNKEFKSQIQEYILNGLNEEFGETTKEQLQALTSEFNNWYSPYEKKRTPNRQEAFKEFLNGLPSSLHTEWTNYGINQTLKGWFETVGEPYKEKDSDKELELHHNLVYRELNTLLKKNDLNLF
jgi:hypothetical protein